MLLHGADQEAAQVLAVAFDQSRGASAEMGFSNISCAISADSSLTRISGRTPARRTAQRLK